MRIMLRCAAALLCASALAACADGPRGDGGGVRGQTIAADAPAQFQTGADRLVANGFAPLKGLRVGLVANHTATSGGRHLADWLAEADSVDLRALFGPEHGFRGDTDDGAAISDSRDSATGIPVYSLYGSRRAPPDSLLAELDVLVFDIQDVGARFYTFISTMGRAMEAAARTGTRFMILDRPNPLGGVRVDGFVLEPEHASFVGLFPIPVQHGLTVGELARMIVGESWLPGLDNLDLRVVEVAGWQRSELWPNTGRDWVPTSPNLPGFEHALVYPGTCLFEATEASEGRGTPDPFLTLGAPWLDAEAAAEAAGAAGLEGVQFEPVRFTPVSIPGKSTYPKWEDRALQGLRIRITDADRVRPLQVGLQALHAFLEQAPDPEEFLSASRMARLGGTHRLRDLLLAGASPDDVLLAWQAEIAEFRRLREPYLLYD